MLSNVLANVWGGIGTLAAFLFVLSIVVVIHELGHFQVARWCGVNVSEFAVGFGREIFGWHDSKGTRWRLNWIPLGGYVKFMDDANGASIPDPQTIAEMTAAERAGSFHAKPLWKRAAVIVAGPMSNFLLAIVLLSGIYMVEGEPVIPARVDGLVAGGAAEAAGLKMGDVIVEIDGTPIDSFFELQRIVSGSAGQKLAVSYRRDGKISTVQLIPQLKEQPDGFGGKRSVGMLGVQSNMTAADRTYKHFGPLEAVGHSVNVSYHFIADNLTYMRKVAVQQESANQLGGPVRIADASGKVCRAGFVPCLQFTAMISVGIGLFNLFPIPPLDGGHLMFYLAEAIRRRPLSEAAQGVGFRLGLAFILMLAILANWNDLSIVKRWLGLGV